MSLQLSGVIVTYISKARFRLQYSPTLLVSVLISSASFSHQAQKHISPTCGRHDLLAVVVKVLKLI